MKKIILLTIVLFTIGASQSINAARISIVYGNGPTLSTTQQLPDSCDIDGQHVNLGVIYDQFSLFWMPLWNYGTPQYTLINDAEDTYWDIDDEMVENLRTEFELDIPQEASIPFWTKVGGKPLVLLLLAYVIYKAVAPKEEEIEATQEKTEA